MLLHSSSSKQMSDRNLGADDSIVNAFTRNGDYRKMRVHNYTYIFNQLRNSLIPDISLWRISERFQNTYTSISGQPSLSCTMDDGMVAAVKEHKSHGHTQGN
uniref:Uncharacterized protein n=1 Tax=Sipha flava TaxID=143950 RepID=A0A2S2QV19_9HEMI